MAKRTYTEEEQHWLETKKEFDEEFENFKAIDHIGQTKEEALRELAKSYDSAFKEEIGIGIDDFIKKYPSYFTFSEMAEYRLTGKKRNQKPKKPAAKSTKLAIRLETGLISEKGLGFSIFNTTKTFNNSNYKVWWIADCIAWAITQKFGIEFDKKKREELFKAGVKTLRDLEKYYSALKEINPERYEREVPFVELTSAEIRKKLGRDKLLNSDIHQLVLDFFGTTVIRMTKKFVGDDKDSWVRFGKLEKICGVEWAETGKFSNRNEQPEYHYHFTFDKAEQLDFWLSVCLGFFDCRPNSYYRLIGGSQQILRAIGWTSEPSNLELEQLCKIAMVADKHVTWRQKTVEGYLNELKEGGFIRDWKKYKKRIPGERKREIRYKIFKVKRLPKQ